MSETLFKVLSKNATSCNGGGLQWNTHGKWMPEIKGIVPCKRGYHGCRPQDLVHWLGPRIHLLYGRGERINCGDKAVFGQARLGRRLKTWNERTARLFACDCTERVLSNIEDCHPTDNHPHEAIRIARLFAEGKATRDELTAAYTAARSAAYTARSASYTARTAACGAAYAACIAACGAACGAYTAARSAAYAARSAAYAACSAACGAEREWQTKRLMEYLEIEL